MDETIVGESFIDEDLVGTYLTPDSDTNAGIAPMFFGHTIKTIVLPYEYRTVKTAPESQPARGYTTQGALISFFQYGGTSKTYTFSIKTNGKWFSTNFSYQTGKTSGTGTGYTGRVPSTSAGQKWTFYFIQDHKIQPTRADLYVDNKYRSSYITTTSTYTLGHEWVRNYG